MTLGQKIRAARIERGMTQKQLVGEQITRNMLSKIENDSATPSVGTLEFLAERLELPAGYFLKDSLHSDGSSPDGLDDMRAAFREGRYLDCISLLENNPSVGTTDEGYLLRTRANLNAAQQFLSSGNIQKAKEYADAADYYNKQSMYYSAAVDAEMSMILAECSLALGQSDFEYHAKEYSRAVRLISFSDRFALARAEHLLKNGEYELCGQLLEKLTVSEKLRAKKLLLHGMYHMDLGDLEAAQAFLSGAEQAMDTEDPIISKRVYAALEKCYIGQENFKLAYEYAAKQLREV